MNPSTVSAAALAAAVVIAVLAGFGGGSILAMLVALAGAAVAGYGTWKGTQQDGQGMMATSMLLFLANLLFAALMLVLRIIDWL